MITVGIDHGTSSIKTCIKEKDKEDYFVMSRRELLKKSYIDKLKDHVNIKDIDLITVCYSMGDRINKIMPIEKVKNRGVISIEGIGEKIGGGTKVYDEILNSNVPAIVMPGLHKNTPSLDERFKCLYSHIASPEKISIAYCAYKKYTIEDFILSDISSNTVSLIIKNGIIRGGFDACIGAIGLLHGPLDLELIRKIDSGEISANEGFSTAGAIKIVKDLYKGVENTKNEILKNYDKNKMCKLAIDSLILSVIMEIGALKTYDSCNSIVLSGSFGELGEKYGLVDEIKKRFSDNLYILKGESGALGGALIAEDILNGTKNILGIDVEY